MRGGAEPGALKLRTEGCACSRLSMAASGDGPSSLAAVARSCRQASSQLVEATKVARTFATDCLKLAKFSKRLQPLLDDLDVSASTVQPQAARTGTAVLQAGLELMHACMHRSPFFPLSSHQVFP